MTTRVTTDLDESGINWAVGPIPPASPRVLVTAIDAVETFASENLELQDRIGDLEGDVSIYQELVCAAFDALHDVTVSRDRERDEHQRVCDEYRALREHLVLQAGADDRHSEETAA